jgi:hypothetical protein
MPSIDRSDRRVVLHSLTVPTKRKEKKRLVVEYSTVNTIIYIYIYIYIVFTVDLTLIYDIYDDSIRTNK